MQVWLAAAGCIATPAGYTATRAIVFTTAFDPVSMTETEKPYSFVTYALLPSPLMATEVGRLPTPIFAMMLFELVSMTDTELELLFTTNARAPSGVIAIAIGEVKPPTVA